MKEMQKIRKYGEGGCEEKNVQYNQKQKRRLIKFSGYFINKQSLIKRTGGCIMAIAMKVHYVDVIQDDS